MIKPLFNNLRETMAKHKKIYKNYKLLFSPSKLNNCNLDLFSLLFTMIHVKKWYKKFFHDHQKFVFFHDKILKIYLQIQKYFQV